MSSKELDDLRRQFTGILRHSAASFRSAALVVEQYAHIVESGGLPSAHEIAQIAAQLPSIHSNDDRKGKKADKSLFPPLSPVDEDDTKKRKRAPKKPKDPLAPKRPAGAYLLYQNQVRGALKEQHPEWTHSELLAEVSKEWATLTDAQKKPFVDATALAKQEYNVAKANYDAGQATANGAGTSTVKSARSTAEEYEDQKAVATIVAAKPRKSKDAVKLVTPPKKEKKKEKAPTPPSTTSSSEEESDVDDDDDDDETDETEEPPKKKPKKEVTPPPTKKQKKNIKEEKGSKKK